MSPYQTAHDWYLSHPQPYSFSHYLIDHALTGFVFITPSFFIMGRPANKALLEGKPSDGKTDTWFVTYACGDLKKAWSILPYYLPYIAFERFRGGKLELTIQLTDRIKNLTNLVT